MNTNKIWIVVIGVLVVLVAGYFLMQSRTGSEVPSSGMPVPGSNVPEMIVEPQ